MPRALITGASSELGAKIAIELAGRGIDLILHYCAGYNKIKILEDTCKDMGVDVISLSCDFNSASLDSFACRCAQFIDLCYLIHNAAVYFTGHISSVSKEEYDQMMNVNVRGPVLITNYVLSNIRQNKGSIINIGVSGMGVIGKQTLMSLFEMSKISLRFFTLALAKEEAENGVSVNMISPSIMENDKTNYGIDKQKVSLSSVSKVICNLCKINDICITGQNIELTEGLGFFRF